MKFGIALIAVILVALIVLNPGPDRFEEVVEAEIRKELRHSGTEMAGDTGGALGDLLGTQVAPLAASTFQRENFYAFSLYSLDLNGEEEGGAWKFLGVVNTFIPLEQPDFDR